MPNPLSEELKEALAKFECLSNPDQFKDHISSLFKTTAENISKSAKTLTDAHNSNVKYQSPDQQPPLTEYELVFRSQYVELRDQIVRSTNKELNKVNGDGAAVPTVDYILLWDKPSDWDSNWTSYYTLSTNGKRYIPVTGESAPAWADDKYYKREETST